MSCNQNCGCGCHSCGCTSLIDSIANALNNLFPTYCNNCGRGNGNNGGCQRNNGCGCQRNSGCGCQSGGTSPANISNTMFVNLFGGRGQNSCGCNQCGCGSNADLTALTACGNQCYDDYYAQQYALYPYNLPSNSCCCY